MAEFFAVAAENLTDTLIVDNLRPIDAALIEPLACVIKSMRMGSPCHVKFLEKPWLVEPAHGTAVIGLGVMGLMHALMLTGDTNTVVGYDLNQDRIAWAKSQGIEARHPDNIEPADLIFVCPGSQRAFDLAMQIAVPEARIVMFAPLGPGESLTVPQEAYFRDISISHSYSCGPDDTEIARKAIEGRKLYAEQVVSQFIGIDELPLAYQQMKRGEILKPMVVF
jgi:L-iditol 2-dehydrogenase